MNQKNEGQELEDNYDNIEIEYNDDFSSEKTKSLNKFPTKIINNNEFYLDNQYKNFSKSLNFNFKRCFAPKPKIKQSNKNPPPIIFEKQKDIYNLNIQDQIITEEAFSEKEVSLENESCSSDYENQNNEINNFNYNKNITNKDIIYNNKNNNFNICKNLYGNNSFKKNEDKNNNLYINKINIIEEEKEKNNLKIYEHKTINEFPFKHNSKKGNLKSIRNNLFQVKLRTLKAYNREVEYSIKDKAKIKYNLDLINNKSKKDEHYEIYKIIPINNNKTNEEEKEDMSIFRKTINFNSSKLNLEKNKRKDEKGITIYDVLTTNNKSKKNK